MRRALRAAMALVGVVLVAAACASTSQRGMTMSGTADHNAQDVTFAQQMVPHHQQAVAMADLAATRASSQQVKDLASRIKGAQGPEIATMQGWLTTWGAAMSPGGHDMSSMAASGMGMMSDADMGTLTGASGTAFDRQFLTMMTAHHNGAIAMAKTELEKGKYQPAKDLATSIRDGQQREVDEMANLLKSVPAA